MSSESLLPSKATPLQKALEQVAKDRLEAVPQPVREIRNPATCPVEALPHLAWEFSVDRWSTDWTEEQQRAAVSAAPSAHRRKGTPASVRRVVEALGYTIEITEPRDDEDLDPFTFRVSVGIGGDGISESEQRTLLQVIEATKRQAAHMDVLEVVGDAVSAELYAAGAVYDGDYTSFEVTAELAPVLYGLYPGFLAAYRADTLSGVEDSAVASWSPVEEGAVSDALHTGTGLTLRLTDGPAGGQCVRIASGSIRLPSAARSALVAAGEGSAYALVRSPGAWRGWQSSGTVEANDEHYPVSSQIYTDFLSTGRDGPTAGTGFTSWHVVAFVRDGGTIRIYQNGVKKRDNTFGTFAVRDPVLALVALDSAHGLVRETAWFDAAHSDADVAELSAAILDLYGL